MGKLDDRLHARYEIGSPIFATGCVDGPRLSPISGRLKNKIRKNLVCGDRHLAGASADAVAKGKDQTDGSCSKPLNQATQKRERLPLSRSFCVL